MKLILFVALCIFIEVLYGSEATAVESQLEEVVEPIIVPKKHIPNGLNPCTYGPAYYCRSIEKMIECNVSKKDCKGRNPLPPRDDVEIEPQIVRRTVVPNGLNPCTYGPRYYCATAERRKECNVPAYECKKTRN